MPMHRADLVTQLEALELALPDILARCTDEADFWPEFAGIADEIVEAALPEDHDYVAGRIDSMLKNAGMIPGEDQGAPCV